MKRPSIRIPPLRVPFKRGGHRILSGKYPLYRYLIFWLAVGSAIQLAYGPPPSVNNTVPEPVAIIFCVFQLVGSLVLLAAIQLMDETSSSARLERIGVVLIGTASFVYIVSLCINNSGIPETFTPYLALGLGCYSVYRFNEINDEIDRWEKELYKKGIGKDGEELK